MHQNLKPVDPAAHRRGGDDDVAARPDEIALVEQIMNIMEQGILVWTADGTCELHNTRIFEVLELDGEDLAIGTTRAAFRDRAVARGEMSSDDREASAARIKAHQAYSFDRVLPSGRVVLTNARPARGGGYVVTFTDVTRERAAAEELERAKRAAEAARQKAQDVLEQERARQTEARRLAELDEWLQSCKSLDELYRIVMRFMERLLPGSKGELYLYSNSRDGLVGTCNWNTRDLHRGIAADSCWALRRGRAYEYRAEGLCFTCDHVEDHEHGVAVHEYLCVPIIAHGDTVGLLHIRFDPASDTGAAAAATVCQAGDFAIRCAEHISMAIANVKLRDELHDQSIRDPLTGLYNRRYFMDALRREIGVADGGGPGFGLISFDADRFKSFNDNHGHDAGDNVLRAICEKLHAVFDPSAICCRMGGEEFAVCLPGADLDRTEAAAEAMREQIAAQQIRSAHALLPKVTVSAGVVVYAGGGGATPNAVLKAADDALYRAKEAGRNRVCRASPPDPGPFRDENA